MAQRISDILEEDERRYGRHRWIISQKMVEFFPLTSEMNWKYGTTKARYTV